MYKRQEAANVDQNKIINLLYDSKNSTDKDFILPDVGVSVKTAFFIPVSYTHLDVYKRQSPARAAPSNWT